MTNSDVTPVTLPNKLLLQIGESPAYVQRQLGHSSIKMTVDTYGKWLPAGNRVAVDKLDQVAPVAAIQEA